MPPAPSRHTLDPNRSVAIGNVDELLVEAWVDTPISDVVYQGYVTTRVALVEQIPLITASLVLSTSFTPNLRQRGMLKEAETALRMEVLRTYVVVSETPAVRNAVATMSWMFPKKWALKSFTGAQLPEAAAFLKAQGVRASEAAILSCVEHLRSLLSRSDAPLADPE